MIPSFQSFPELPSSTPASKTDDSHKRRKRDKKREKSPKPQTRVDSEHSRPPETFISDRRGDTQNIHYGKLDSRDVPKYHSGRIVLGLSDSFKVTRTGFGIEVGARGQRQMPSLSDASSRALLSRHPTRSFIATSSSKYEEYDGFLKLPSRSSKQDYRDIEKAANSDTEDSVSSAAEESSDEETFTSHEMKVINQRLATDPSIENWLLLLSHTLAHNVPPDSKNSTKARAEISLSILSRALVATGKSPQILSKYLEAGEDIWSEDKLRSEWEDALRNANDLGIWMSWIDWRWRACKNGISEFIHDVERASTALGQDQVSQTMVLWRLAVALKSAGYFERATALFQAQAEIAFHLPSSLAEQPWTQVLDALEEYWESEVPRFGEHDSMGWATWLSSGRPVTIPPPLPRPEPVIDLDPYRNFAFTESAIDKVSILGRRSTDAETDLDPYSLILFSDLRGALFPMRTSEAKNLFRYAWISLLGLNMPSFPYIGDKLYDKWALSSFVRPASLNRLFPVSQQQTRITSDAAAGTIIGRQRDYANGLECPIVSWGWDAFQPLDVPSASGKSTVLWKSADLVDVNTGFIANLFQQLRMPDDHIWDSYALAFTCAGSIKTAIKMSRGFLSTAPDSIHHWAMHGRLEQLRNRPAEARKVYETVLLTGSPRLETAPLWYDWAEMEWLEGQSDATTRVLLLSVGIEGTGGVPVLRAKRSLDDNIKRTEGSLVEAWIKLRAMLEMSTSGPELAIQVFANNRSSESLVLAKLLLLYRYGMVLRRPMRPGLFRDSVESAVQQFPGNSILLGLFLESQRGQVMWGKVRNRLVHEEKNVVQRLQDVWIAGWDGRWEMQVERTRSGLSAAIDGERARHSLTMWRMVLEFEIRIGNLKRAKQLFFQAVGECPLVKDLYLLAFGALRAVFNGHELNEIADTMVERHVRLRRGLDEFIDGWQDEVRHNEDSDSEADEMLVDAQDFRARLPF
ncbi:hypothetical protein MIND_00472200 [Mycena indigotica]|uniref:DUF1740-domain-containing protein n=1 Tax=Mycena indigotica TaxID=2126181 RepID=A0A8H6SZM8_9AGAR|nr:uncharacterized protein MIND_00472200 [Mycena indigotica]KAF7306805.1 hypothetical protein MIND_00472200 [Mycena indigotica]